MKLDIKRKYIICHTYQFTLVGEKNPPILYLCGIKWAKNWKGFYHLSLESLIHLKLFFLYVTNRRRDLFSFPVQFRPVIGSLTPLSTIRRMEKHHLLQPQVIGGSTRANCSKMDDLALSEKAKKIWVVPGSLMKRSIIYLPFYRAFGKFSEMKGVIALKTSHY